jgi:hypothetical protein
MKPVKGGQGPVWAVAPLIIIMIPLCTKKPAPDSVMQDPVLFIDTSHPTAVASHNLYQLVSILTPLHFIYKPSNRVLLLEHMFRLQFSHHQVHHVHLLAHESPNY